MKKSSFHTVLDSAKRHYSERLPNMWYRGDKLKLFELSSKLESTMLANPVTKLPGISNHMLILSTKSSVAAMEEKPIEHCV